MKFSIKIGYLASVFHENKLPGTCSVHDIGFKVLSMKISYLAPVPFICMTPIPCNEGMSGIT